MRGMVLNDENEWDFIGQETVSAYIPRTTRFH